MAFFVDFFNFAHILFQFNRIMSESSHSDRIIASVCKLPSSLKQNLSQILFVIFKNDAENSTHFLLDNLFPLVEFLYTSDKEFLLVRRQFRIYG